MYRVPIIKTQKGMKIESTTGGRKRKTKALNIPDKWLCGFTMALPGRPARTIGEAVAFWRDQEIKEHNVESKIIYTTLEIRILDGYLVGGSEDMRLCWCGCNEMQHEAPREDEVSECLDNECGCKSFVAVRAAGYFKPTKGG